MKLLGGRVRDPLLQQGVALFLPDRVTCLEQVWHTVDDALTRTGLSAHRRVVHAERLVQMWTVSSQRMDISQLDETRAHVRRHGDIVDILAAAAARPEQPILHVHGKLLDGSVNSDRA